jgi:AraC family transcriptional regulator of adaptative response / DNA-3-methyladenine glycosylase II
MGWIRVTQSNEKHALMLEFTHSLTPMLPALLSRARALFESRCAAGRDRAASQKDPRLAQAVKRNPGIRVPGAFNGFELGLRAILGQQVTVKAATTIACRVVEAFGDPIVTPFAELNRLTPMSSKFASASVDDIARHGIPASRARTIIALAEALTSGSLRLDAVVPANPMTQSGG